MFLKGHIEIGWKNKEVFIWHTNLCTLELVLFLHHYISRNPKVIMRHHAGMNYQCNTTRTGMTPLVLLFQKVFYINKYFSIAQSTLYIKSSCLWWLVGASDLGGLTNNLFAGIYIMQLWTALIIAIFSLIHTFRLYIFLWGIGKSVLIHRHIRVA